MASTPENRTDESAGRVRILVVDDSKLMRRAIMKILGDKYDIVEGMDGEDGWNRLSSDDNIHAVISDLSMPNLDGFGFLDIIRGSDDTRIRELPVIIITGADDDEVVKEKALSHGATDFIVKPFDSAQLHARVGTHVKLTKTTKDLIKSTDDLKEQSAVDPLTRLANQRYFRERCLKDLAFAKRHKQDLSLLRIDIDRFNEIFIRYGKDTSNAILVKLSDLFKEATRTEDTIARVGVAKFAMMLPNVGGEGSRCLGERLQETIAQAQVGPAGQSIAVTVSIGIAAPYILPDTELDELLNSAEASLAEAIAAGGNRIVMKEGLPDYEQALSMIAEGQEDAVAPHLAGLLHRLLPLLELYNSRHAAGLDGLIGNLRGRTVYDEE